MTLYIVLGLALLAALVLYVTRPDPLAHHRVHRRPRYWTRAEVAMEISRAFRRSRPQHLER